MKTADHKNRQNGTTLVEVILSAAILAILGITALTALFYPRQLIVSQGLKRAAISAAASEMERLRATPYDDIVLGPQPVRDLSGLFSVNGRTVAAATTVYRQRFSSFEYHVIHTEVSYPGGETPVVMETIRSP